MTALEVLIKAPESINPAILKSLELTKLDAEGKVFTVGAKALLEMKPVIDKAIKAGRAEADAVRSALELLRNSVPQSSKTVPEGF